MSKRKRAIRRAFRESVYERDNHQCVMCGASNTKLDALEKAIRKSERL